MLQFIFNKVLVLSACSAGVFIMLKLLFWILKDNISVRQKYGLLVIPVLLCVIPISFGRKQESLNYEAAKVQTEVQSPDAVPAADNIDVNTMVTQAAPQAVEPEPDRTAENKINFVIYIDFFKQNIAWAWLITVFCLLIFKAVRNIRFKKLLKRIETEPAEHVREVFESINHSKRIRLKCFDGVSTPFVTGVFAPVIFMPITDMSDYELRLALMHELTHIKSGDLALKAAADIISGVHFFNPFIYLIKHDINTYCELSCDAAVTRNMNEEMRRDYGKMLLTMMRKESMAMQSVTCLTEGHKNMKRRIEIIMNRNKLGMAGKVFSAILVLAIAVGSTAFAAALGGLDNSEPPKAIYHGDITGISDAVNDNYSNIYMHTEGGAVTYTNFLGRTEFAGSYFAMPEELANKIDELSDNGSFDEANKIFNDDNSYSDYYQIRMDKKVREYGNGRYMEGLFTLIKNGEIVFENQVGYLQELPPDITERQYMPSTVLYIQYEKDGNTHEYELTARLMDRTSEQQRETRMKNAEFNRLRSTKKVKLGTAEEIIYNGENIDVSEINQRLENTEAEPWNNSLAEIEYNKDMNMAFAVIPVGKEGFISLWTGEKALCSDDTIKGAFKLDTRRYISDVINVTVSGLLNEPGGTVELKSDDGRYYARFVIVPDIKEPLSVRGTREVSEFLVEGEDVFIGTPSEQDEFDRDEHSVFYKRIITDDYGKVIAVVPIEYQQGENIVEKEGVAYSYSNTWEGCFGRVGVFKIDGSGNMVKDVRPILLQDPGTWWIRAAIPPEYLFYVEIE